VTIIAAAISAMLLLRVLSVRRGGTRPRIEFEGRPAAAPPDDDQRSFER